MDVNNILIVPLIDSENIVQGVIQLVNKIDSDEILKEDVNELTQICPSIAEVINFCELAKDVNNVSAGLTTVIDSVMDGIEKSQDHF